MTNYKGFLVIILSACIISLYGQKDIDSYKEHIQKIQELSHNFPDSAYVLAKTLISDNVTKKALNYSLIAGILMRLSKRDECKTMCDSAIILNTQIKNYEGISECYSVLAANYQNQADYVNAVKYHNLTIDLASKHGLYDLVNFSYRSLSKISQVTQKFDESLNYLNKAVAITPKTKHADINILNYHAFGDHYGTIGNFELSNQNYEKAYHLAIKLNKELRAAWSLSLWAINYAGSDLNKTLSMMLEAQKIYDRLAPHSTFSLTNLSNVGEVFAMISRDETQIKKFNVVGYKADKVALSNQALEYMTKVLNISRTNKDKFNEMNATGNLANLYQSLDKYKDAYSNLSAYSTLKDSIFSQESKNKIAKLEAEKDLIQLQDLNKQKSLFNKILVYGSLALLSILFLGYRDLKHKQKIQQQHINELEREKQLAAIDALLKGQEEERSRIAKDLHDGLGGMLNGVKLQFNNMREDIVMTSDNVATFQTSLNQLDNIISELRRVSHNLMPDVLIRFGLNDALKDFCTSQSNENTKVNFQQMGEERTVNHTSSLYIYRIIQELVSNAVKHGKASEIIAQLTYARESVLITVDDNGIGYNIADLLNCKGVGMRSVKQRVDYLLGEMEIDSKLGVGTSVNIELKV